MLVGVSQPQMVKPVPPKRPVCKCGGRRGKVNVLIWGDLSQCAACGLGGAVRPLRVVLMGQKSAEAIVLTGILVVGKGRTLGIDGLKRCYSCSHQNRSQPTNTWWDSKVRRYR